MTGNLVKAFAIKNKGCRCAICRAMCMRPCWPKPHEAIKIINAGLGGRLMMAVGRDFGETEDYALLCPAIKGYEGKIVKEYSVEYCTFYDSNKLCELHDKDLKPIEALLSHHDHSGWYPQIWNANHRAVILSWDTDEGRKTVELWRKKYGIEKIS